MSIGSTTCSMFNGPSNLCANSTISPTKIQSNPFWITKTSYSEWNSKILATNHMVQISKTSISNRTHTHTRARAHAHTHMHTHTHLMALFPGLPKWASTRKVKPIWILLKQETVSGSGISWAICKSASCSRQTTTPAPHHSVFYRPDALPAAQPTASKHWRQNHTNTSSLNFLQAGCSSWHPTNSVKAQKALFNLWVSASNLWVNDKS